MDRGKIKIIEFGKDEEGPRASTPEFGGVRSMKIVEFDNEPARGGGRAVAKPEPGRIRIVEFDDDRSRTTAARAAPPEGGPSLSRARVGAIKIKEFDDEGQERPRGSGGTASRIKIVEFD